MRTLLILAALVTLAPVPTSDSAQQLAGRYYNQFPDGLVTGEKYTGENIVEIVPVASGAAYVRLHLDYYNGHTCALAGVAHSVGDALVYQSKDDWDDQTCVLKIRRTGKSLSIDDNGDTCKGYCGARGSLSGVQLPFASKRPIRYLARLKRSPQYAAAIAEWRKGKQP